MKVLYVIDSLNRGGAEILALDVCRNAARHGLEMTLVATGSGTLEDDFRNSGVEFISLQRKLPIDLSVVRKLRKIILSRQIEIVHGYQAVEVLHAYLSTIKTKVKRVMSFHGHITDAKNRHTLNFLIPRMDANIVISQALYNSLTNDDHLNLNHNLKFVYNGVDEKRLERPERDIREELGLKNDSVLMGMVGNFYHAPRKDHLTVCKSLPRVFSEIADIHFLFVFAGGQNEDKDKLDACVNFCVTNGISNRVHFLGNKIPAIDVVKSLDIFVLSSLHEGLPISVKEAMLLGKPCVLSNIEPLLEISDNGKYGVIFKTGDAEDLAEKLIDLTKDSKKRNELGIKNREWASQRFSIDAHLKSLKELYQNLIEEQSNI